MGCTQSSSEELQQTVASMAIRHGQPGPAPRHIMRDIKKANGKSGTSEYPVVHVAYQVLLDGETAVVLQLRMY